MIAVVVGLSLRNRPTYAFTSAAGESVACCDLAGLRMPFSFASALFLRL